MEKQKLLVAMKDIQRYKVLNDVVEKKLKVAEAALYADKASYFKTTRHGGLHYNIVQEHEETQIERALEELGINIIPANSPQAKRTTK